ncbi:hypothetical protein HS088_TW13G01294 [Tripterygium wilfordii]|uniref:Wax synthase domain-containing protein n=1 Tax=Tripterygium wilfordii TaxID=458696 RepID=A0A7J7CW92_TRIWF|nr:hypothetical protein HS088_TW13G01294 [Tripterygium wilfordii]
MEGEMRNYAIVWLQVLISASFIFFIAKKLPKGLKRLISVLPIVCLFLYLPLNLHTAHLGGGMGFIVSWLANFKLLLFAFDKGPLSNPRLSLGSFVALTCLPIKIQQNPPPQNSHKSQKSPLNYAIKILIFGLVLCSYEYGDYMHQNVVAFLNYLHLYLSLDMGLAVLAALARATLGLELEPQFNEPYLSSSLQDFWGRRWNLMVSRTLRPTVYEPTRDLATRFVSRKWAALPAVFMTFVVSAVMHELMLYYLARGVPSLDFGLFFVLHGLGVVVEIALKKAFADRCRLPWMISGPLTLGFAMVTGCWLFLPPLRQCNQFERMAEERRYNNNN